MNVPLVLLNRRRRGSVGYNPAGLFALNEPGIWLDPSDVANLDWRRNLLTWTEQFDNAAWVNNGGTVSANALVAPDGTTTADYLVRSSAAGDGRYQVITAGTAGVCTVSVYIKKDTSNNSLIWLYDATAVADRVFATIAWSGSTPVVTATVGTAATPQDVGNGWWRLSVTSTSLTGANTNRFYLLPAYTGSSNGQQTAFWGAQLELGSVATDYQRITDVNTEVLERFPRTTMYQDRAGSTAVTTPGQSVGLRLDKSKGLVLGSELAVNGAFDTDTSWNKETGWSISGGSASKASGTGGSLYQGAAAMVQGRTYQITFTVSGYSAGTLTPFCRGTAGTGVTANGTYTQRLIAGADSVYAINLFAGATFVGTIDNISVKELPGNHAVANSDAARGIYGIEPLGGRRNLLTFTEQFQNAVWTLDNSGATNPVVTANFGAAPDGSITADRIQLNKTGGLFSRIQQSMSFLPSAVYTFSVWLRNNATGTANVGIRVDGSGVNCAVTETWQRFLVTLSPAGTTATAQILLFDSIVGNDETADILAWGAQLETGSTATAYQRVTTQYDVTEAGKQTLHYVQYDGSDDGYVTPTITPGTDKVQVFAGVRKLSDAASVLIESSANLNLNFGSFAFYVGDAGGRLWSWASSGSLASPVGLNIAAPDTAVLSGIGNISADVSTIRRNGASGATSTSDQGTGNYLAYLLYIGRRAGTSLPFNGRDYGIVVRFGANLDASTISATESWLNQKTGAY